MFDFWGRPRTIDQPIRDRKISWLELFYDLIFAVVLARLTDGVLANWSWSTLGYATLLFWWFFWGWNETSSYFDNHGNDAPLNVVMINLQMILTGIGALLIDEALQGQFNKITLVLILIDLLAAGIWYWVAYFDPIHRAASTVWANVHLVALVLLGLSLFLPHWGQLGLLVLALLLNWGDIFFTNPNLEREYQQTEMVHQLKDSLIERYGLLTMIALGEIIAGLYTALTGENTGIEILTFSLSIVLVALISGSYYQILGELHLRFSSSIRALATGWLFIDEIFLIFLLGLSLHFLLATAGLASKLIFVGLLFATLMAMWLIELIAEWRQALQWGAALRFKGLVLFALVLAAWLPRLGLLVVTDLVLALVIIHGRRRIKRA